MDDRTQTEISHTRTRMSANKFNKRLVVQPNASFFVCVFCQNYLLFLLLKLISIVSEYLCLSLFVIEKTK